MKEIKLQVNGKSMGHLIEDGDFVVVKIVQPHRLRVSDIILFHRNDSEFVCHRIVKKEESCGKFFFTTKGDAFNRADPPISESAIIGKIVSVEKNGKLLNLETPKWQFINWTIFWTSPIRNRVSQLFNVREWKLIIFVKKAFYLFNTIIFVVLAEKGRK